MPRFSPKGPVVPDSLVQDLEDDRVVVFCGAGISMGAGLPSFTGLVSHCYNELGVPLPPNKSEEWLWPDRMLGSLEARCSQAEVRRTIVDRLSAEPKDLELHAAILKLARLRRVDGLRLVTTNFDTIFERAQESFVFGQDLHSGPILPIPRNDRIASWRSIAYLHGRIAPAPASNDHLVITSADFGRAYLTEGWAARFVARLFADFTVLFIGYSLNDPVLRYMTDAFAAEEDSKITSGRGPAYIFVPYKGSNAPDPEAWRHRHLEPIFYNQAYHHRRLKQTIVAWAEARQDFLSSSGAIVDRLARSTPQSLDPSDTENLLWAIMGRPNDAGHGARVFAGIQPPPPIDWLFELERQEAVLLETWERDKARAVQQEEPAPVRPPTSLQDLIPPVSKAGTTILSPTGNALCDWIVRHLDSIQMVDWVIEKLEQNRRLHHRLRYAISERLPKATEEGLGEGFVAFWRIASAEGMWAQSDPNDWGWLNLSPAKQEDAAEPWFQQDFLAQWRPYIRLSKAIFRHWREKAYGASPEVIGERIGTVVEAKVQLSGGEHLRLLMQKLDSFADPDAFLAINVTQFTALLHQALDLFAVVGRAGENWDPSVHDRPSIEPHDQNHHFKDWASLFDLIWRGWLRVDGTDAERSRQIVQHWRSLRYLSFRRLAVAALAKSSSFTAAEKLEILLNG